ncbi:hypothetical protein LZP69_01350 [Shewanella sp. AS1]|uniref:hypothetical protein n=1 Tax=Shewanella sp. AS1 TaxID=2907626 RepID=UPI001F44F868|nr:hypothetical protein [Shewanella sp. AS1]MCE9677838.1 hypothetical protein [Shewanella sp. AS1]
MSDSFFGSKSSCKPLSMSCQSCERLTVIEGENICFKAGEVIRLIPCEQQSSKLTLLCSNWKVLASSRSA